MSAEYDAALARVFAKIGAPYEPTRCDKCGWVGYTGHRCSERLKMQAAERLARLVIASAPWSLDKVRGRAINIEGWEELVTEARAVLGEEP